MDLTETTLRQHRLYEGRVVNLRRDDIRLPNGREAVREVVEHHGGVCVAALTDADELLFVRQFRYPYKEVVTELPAGKLEPGEDPLAAGKRELEEETGFTAGRYLSLGRLYPSPGYTAEVIWLYLATDLRPGVQHPDEDEFLEVSRLPVAEAEARVMAGEWPDAKTQTAVLKVAAWLRGGRQGLSPAE